MPLPRTVYRILLAVIEAATDGILKRFIKTGPAGCRAISLFYVQKLANHLILQIVIRTAHFAQRGEFIRPPGGALQGSSVRESFSPVSAW